MNRYSQAIDNRVNTEEHHLMMKEISSEVWRRDVKHPTAAECTSDGTEYE